MEATVQVNARMSRKLKEEGDAALTRIGLSPTQAIRALWSKAAKRGEDLAQVEQLLAPRPEVQPIEAEPVPNEPSQRVYDMADALYRQLGVDPIVTRKRDINDDLEDNFVLAAAECAQVDYLVTSDKALIRKSTVPAFTPEDASTLIAAGIR